MAGPLAGDPHRSRVVPVRLSLPCVHAGERERRAIAAWDVEHHPAVGPRRAELAETQKGTGTVVGAGVDGGSVCRAEDRDQRQWPLPPAGRARLSAVADLVRTYPGLSPGARRLGQSNTTGMHPVL